MTAGAPVHRFDDGWLSLREPADAAARSGVLVDQLRARLRWRDAPASPDAALPSDVRPLRVLDLGSGTGSTTRWLGPQLTASQRWTLLDHDPDLLALARKRCAGVRAADGRPVEVRTRVGDLADLNANDTGGVELVTASALLDLLTHTQVDHIARICAAAGITALFTLSVAGEVEVDPLDPLDRHIAAAFDAHQCRAVGGSALLGAEAVAATSSVFAARGYDVRVAKSPWRLGAGSGALIRSWLAGWLSAAAEQDRTLDGELVGYRERRLEQLAAGGLRVVVHHHDLLALPPADH